MQHPQTAIKKFNDSTCLFMCYLFCVGIEPDTLQNWLKYYISALDDKCIDENGYVVDGEKLLYRLTGRKFKIMKKTITDISEIKQMAPVQYVYGNYGHFVVVENGKIIFNPLEDSNCVNKGKPASARIISL